MEFPHLGKHCSEQTCNRLDFLPMKCDACDKIFCSSHFNYERHSCSSSHRKNVQVPICPLCGEPVPTAPGVEPDITVGQHIDKQCKSDTKKIFTNRCNFKGCKRKELVPVICSQCRQNYCLRHRHVADHNCNTAAAPKMSEDDRRALAAHAAEYRRSHKPTSLFNTNARASVATAAARPAAAVTQRNSAITSNTSQMQSIQGNMTEDEALARALALSIIELDESADRNRRTETTSASGATVSVGGRDGQTSAKDKCSLS